MISRILLAGTALVTLAVGSAMAADLSRPAPAPVYKAPPAPLTYDWTGIYIGGDGGYGWGTSSGSVTTIAGAPLATYSFNSNGPLAGGFIGGNYQINQFVLGIEGDWQWSNLTGNSGAIALLGGGGPLTVSTTVKNYGSIRGRLGVAFDRFLVFGTGGWAWGNYSTSYATPALGTFITNNPNSSNGWAAGGGVEYAFTDNFIGRVEYRYTSLGTSSFANVPFGVAETGNKVTISDIRAGLEWKFGPSGIAARY